MEKIVKGLQHYINSPFTYSGLAAELEKHRSHLLIPGVIEKTTRREYNSLWSLLEYVEAYFKPMNNDGLIVVSNLSVLNLFNQFNSAKYENFK